MSSKRRQESYKYQQKDVLCCCSDCKKQDKDGVGLRIPYWQRRIHAEAEAKRGTNGQPPKKRYKVTSTNKHGPRASVVFGACGSVPRRRSMSLPLPDLERQLTESSFGPEDDGCDETLPREPDARMPSLPEEDPFSMDTNVPDAQWYGQAGSSHESYGDFLEDVLFTGLSNAGNDTKDASSPALTGLGLSPPSSSAMRDLPLISPYVSAPVGSADQELDTEMEDDPYGNEQEAGPSEAEDLGWTFDLRAREDDVEADGVAGHISDGEEEYANVDFAEADTDDGISEIEIPLSAVPPVYSEMRSLDSTFSSFEQSHSTSHVRILSLLMAYLHFAYHLPHAGVQITLAVVYLLLQKTGIHSVDNGLPLNARAPRTLRTIYKRLGISDRFCILPVCRRCWRIFGRRCLRDATEDEADVVAEDVAASVATMMEEGRAEHFNNDLTYNTGEQSGVHNFHPDPITVPGKAADPNHVRRPTSVTLEDEVDEDADAGSRDAEENSDDTPSRCRSCDEPLYERQGTQDVPRLQTPYHLLSEMLPEFLAQPGVQEALHTYLKVPASVADEYNSMSDGTTWKDMKGPDGRNFFPRSMEEAEEQGEIRLGALVGFDGFGYQRSPSSPSHSTGVLSTCWANLTANLRYRVHNLMLNALTPGPKEPNCDELQHFLRHFVDDLLRLWKDGIHVRTPSHPKGIFVRVAVVAVVCDHPALCKMCGFGDHRHKEMFCTQCKVKHSDLVSGAALNPQEFEARDGAQHKRRAYKYYTMTDDAEKDEYFRKYSVRWSEFNRLPYFDPVKQSVIDPMHCLLLGLVKHQWYNVWVLGGKDSMHKILRARTETRSRELDMIHDILNLFEMPSWAARLPSQIGYPAGGSLTSDEWKCLAISKSDEEYLTALNRYQENLGKYVREKQRWEEVQAGRNPDAAAEGAPQRRGRTPKVPTKAPTPPKVPRKRIPPGTVHNFLNLSAALKILMQHSISEAELLRVEQLYDAYLQGFKEIYGEENVIPSMHWAKHMCDQVRRFGPVSNFWTFLFERLNKTLKSFKVNNHGNGELEVTFAREFKRESSVRNLIAVLATQTEDDLATETAQLLQKCLSDARGTIASFACEQKQEAQEYAQRFALLGLRIRETLSDVQLRYLAEFYAERYPNQQIYHPRVMDLPENGQLLNTKADYFKAAILQGRRVVASRFLETSKNSLVMIPHRGRRWVGEVREIFRHVQPNVDMERPAFAFVEWLKHRPGLPDCYNQFAELEIDQWEYAISLGPADDGPSQLILLSDIHAMAVRATLTDDDGNPVWITAGLSQHGPAI